MDKNDYLRNLVGGHTERIGDWTPQQLADFIQGQSNDPTQMPHAFRARSMNLSEHLVIGGKQFEHAVIPRGVTMGDAKGKAVGVYPRLSGSSTLNGAYAALDPVAKKVFAETFDARLANGTGAQIVSGTTRMAALFVPHKSRLTNMYINYTTFEVGGTFTYGGYALYGPLKYDGSIPGINKTAVPQVAITETNTVTNFRATGPHFVANGYHAMSSAVGWDIVLEPGIYFVAVLGVWSVAPTTNAAILDDLSAAPGIATADLAVPGFIESGTLAGATVLPSTLDITLFTFSPSRLWCALYDDSTKQI